MAKGPPRSRRTSRPRPSADRRVAKVLRQIRIDANLTQRALGTRVAFRPAKEGGGTLTIHFGSDEELNALYEKLGGEQFW